jgi:hypothetical protein
VINPLDTLPKNHGGADIPQYFALALTEQCIMRLMTDESLQNGSFNASALGKTSNQISEKMLVIEEQLTAANCFDYPDWGDIHDVFDIIQGRTFRGKFSDWMKEKEVSLEVDAEKVLAICLEEVVKWWPAEKAKPS